ncbi:MAG: Hpt domain-containing protein [Oscillospiraceae bacterium]
MGLLEELKGLNVNTEEALVRFMNNASLYERMLLKLPKNIEALEVLSHIDSGDYNTAVTNAHTIKGVVGNLSLTPLYTAYTEIVNLLRADKPQEARQILVDALPVQEEILNCIKKYA